MSRPVSKKFEMSLAERRLIRIGIIEAMPWSYRTETGTWEGFCIDLINVLAERMDFDYELVVSEEEDTMPLMNETSPEGIISNLVNGKTDMAIATITMSAGKGELVDYITPYFENSGISIGNFTVMRPVRKSSVFKFLTVLSLDVWLSIIGAILITSLVFWLIEKVLPTQKDVPVFKKNQRKFTLKESLWFAVTTFASQGVGEIPSSLPHRVLIASYWVFVLVMMTTFTANMAAFLTVERLQTPISSLWELTRQTRIKYTVVANSHAHSYFKNMKYAEDVLFSLWKDLILTQTAENESSYRIYDYPIREEYRYALAAIEKNEPVPSAYAGFIKVLENEKGEFALIHDTAEIRYRTYQDCRLIEVGEIFGERPYSIALRKHSDLRNEINNRVLDLHDERYFEALSAKYWNSSLLASCSFDDDGNESITLDSLGGVFIAAISGTILALIALIFEVSREIRKRKVDQHHGHARSSKLANLSKTSLVRVRDSKEQRWKIDRSLRNRRSNLNNFLAQFPLKDEIKINRSGAR